MMITVQRINEKTMHDCLEKRAARNERVGGQVTKTVEQILARVKQEGDSALRAFCEQFDGYFPEKVSFGKEELARFAAMCDPDLLAAMERAAANIRAFHQKQCAQGWSQRDAKGVLRGQLVRGLDKVGIYVPGGTAAYPSSVLMCAIPAKLAGVGEIIMTTPSKDGGVNTAIMAAAHLAGVDRVFLLGGAQAVAAMAYGTRTVPKVDKIVGPGNIYVATAKRLVFGEVDIDMIAGPSEILILADQSANPAFLAADMMSQAEHDALASAILVTDDERLAKSVCMELERQVIRLPRGRIIKRALSENGGVYVCDSMEQAVAFSNALAPEHLEICCEDAPKYLERIRHAGSIFLGHYTPEPMGDYYAGPNHVLPTGGTARFSSPLGVDSFTKKMSFISYPASALRDAANDVMALAAAEGLDAHAGAVKVRL